MREEGELVFCFAIGGRKGGLALTRSQDPFRSSSRFHRYCLVDFACPFLLSHRCFGLLFPSESLFLSSCNRDFPLPLPPPSLEPPRIRPLPHPSCPSAPLLRSFRPLRSHLLTLVLRHLLVGSRSSAFLLVAPPLA